MDLAFVAPKRRVSHETDFRLCIICQTISDDDLNNLTKRGIDSFVNALQLRHDDVYDRLQHSIQDIDAFLERAPKCHRSCRSRYTHKRDLEMLETKRVKRNNDPEIQNTNTSVKPNRSSPVCLKSHCFICKKKRDSKGERKLILVATEQRQRAIYWKAVTLQDQAMLLKIQGMGNEPIDMIAADFRYHKSCLDKFMNRRPSIPSCSSSKTDEYDLAFRQLLSEITDRLIKDRSAFYITQLRDKYRNLLREQGVVNAMQYRTDRLSKRLLDHYGPAIQIIPQKGKASLVCSADITVGEMCALAMKLQEEAGDNVLQTESGSSDEETPLITKVKTQSNSHALAKHLHVEMKEKAKTQRQLMKRKSSEASPTESNIVGDLSSQENRDSTELLISYEAASRNIPDDLYNHLAWLMTNTDETIGKNDRVPLTKTQNEQVLNVAQDIMVHVTGIPMPKQVGLALHILKQTRSKTLVRIMNKFGHTISYDDAQRYITTKAKEIDIQTSETGIFIPLGLVPGKFTQCAFDNLDFQEHTKDGSTLHATSHNIYQHSTRHEPVTSVGSVSLTKDRHRTVPQPESFHVPESYVRLKDRQEARSLHGVRLGNAEPTIPMFKDDYFIWSLLRLLATRNDEDAAAATKAALTWNGFYELLCEEKHVQAVIRYGPLYPQSPTDPGVVQASLDYCISLTNKMQQQTSIVTVDQAIYDIVKGITSKNPEKYRFLVVRLGGFHIAENFMGCIGFLMKDSGIEDILVESEVCKRGTANKIIAGKDYYKMIKKQQQHIQDVLEILKVEFELVDVMVSEEAKIKMRKLSNNPKAIPPQLFNEDHFCGNYEDFEDAVELKEVEKFLKL